MASLTSILAPVGKALGVNVATNLSKECLGWATKGMGLNVGGLFVTPGEMERQLLQIMQEIQQLQTELQTLASEFFALEQVTSLEGTTALIDTANGSLQSNANLYSENPDDYTTPVHYSNSNPAFGNQLTATITTDALSLSDYNQAVILLLSNLLGPAPIGPEGRLERSLVNITFPPMGITTSLKSFDGYGARSNSILSGPNNLIQYYANYVQTAFNLLAETSHMPGESPLAQQISVLQGTGPVVSGQVTLPQVARQLKLVQQQVPDLAPSDDVFVDLVHAKVWYMVSFGNLMNYEAYNTAWNFTGPDGYYTPGNVWRIPTKDELGDLYNTYLSPGAHAQAVKDNKRSQVLKRLGFDLSAMEAHNDLHQVWCVDSVSDWFYPDGAEFSHYFSLDDGKTSHANTNHRHDLLIVHDPGYTDPHGSGDPSLVRNDLGMWGLSSPANLQITLTEDGNLMAKADYQGGGASGMVQWYSPDNPDRGQAPYPVINFDVTTKVAWSSNNDAVASVSNFDGSEGTVYWHCQFGDNTLTPITITAELLGQSASITLQPPADGAPAVLSSILIDPYNIVTDPITPTNLVYIDFNATLFYEDPVTLDRRVRPYVPHSGSPTDPIDPSTNIVWTLVDDDGNPVTSGPGTTGFVSGFTTPDTPNRCYFNSLLKTSFLKVRAALGNVIGEVPVQVDIKS